ncbi:hypothetical protein EVAR_93678_1 [Eumeta japonica]|uniref:Uncharacterized protein n=1 Tax=Eumeta variegata TaxID=151549 RepID=A0A4C1TQP2_EUMVA|nr:hypothetical protein EVAR_93678_1 [Eumeta japonica]
MSSRYCTDISMPLVVAGWYGCMTQKLAYRRIPHGGGVIHPRLYKPQHFRDKLSCRKTPPRVETKPAKEATGEPPKPAIAKQTVTSAGPLEKDILTIMSILRESKARSLPN